ncbi:MAG: glutathione S-transferase family protein [Alphaproteobacteria bacterium]|nr:glutathione S-transferase family protein [Alphaproteobacteria bacterium]
MLELYHNAMSTCSQKVRLCLAEKRQDWVDHHLDLRAGDQHRPEYLALNPNGVVPTLVDDGEVIIESTVINEYLDERFPDPALHPRDPLGRARMRLWTKQLDEGLHAETGVMSNAIAFRFQKLAKGEEFANKLVEGIPDPAKRERYRSVVFEGVESPLFVSSIKRFRKLLDDMDAALDRHHWLAGDVFSLADVGLAPYITRMDHLGLNRMWLDQPRIADWYKRVTSRPSYEPAFVRLFDDKYLALMREKGREYWPQIEACLESA